MDQTNHAIRLEGVGVLRGGRWILHDVTRSIAVGSCTAVLGPNGSGKSTLAKVAAGQLFPSAGRVSLCGREFGNADLSAMRKRIGLVQSAGIAEPPGNLTASQVVLTGFFGTIGLYDTPDNGQTAAASQAIARVGLAAVGESPYRLLSAGERMRCLIARALAIRPALLVLDEPAAGLDLPGREQVLAAIADAHAADASLTSLIITHHLEELPENTADVLLLREGRLVAAGPAEQTLTSETLSDVYRCPVQVKRIGFRYFATADPRRLSAWMNDNE